MPTDAKDTLVLMPSADEIIRRLKTVWDDAIFIKELYEPFARSGGLAGVERVAYSVMTPFFTLFMMLADKHYKNPEKGRNKDRDTLRAAFPFFVNALFNERPDVAQAIIAFYSNSEALQAI